MLDNYSEPSLKSSAFFVTFKGLFDFYFESRSNEEGWSVVEDRHQKMLESNDLTPSMKDHLMKMMAELPERKNTWIELYKGWNELKNSALSNKNLRAWEQTYLQTVTN
ncbi:hypothetical protein [Acinetobacter pittii]|uniref:hypothetical protein n=1 Tax=Acinetobacter pittii TaxID=48296 RepID=UPI0039F51856